MGIAALLVCALCVILVYLMALTHRETYDILVRIADSLAEFRSRLKCLEAVNEMRGLNGIPCPHCGNLTLKKCDCPIDGPGEGAFCTFCKKTHLDPPPVESLSIVGRWEDKQQQEDDVPPVDCPVCGLPVNVCACRPPKGAKPTYRGEMIEGE